MKTLEICQTYLDKCQSRSKLQRELKEYLGSLNFLSVSQKKSLRDAAITAACTVEERSQIDKRAASGNITYKNYSKVVKIPRIIDEPECKDIVKLVGSFERHNSSVRKKAQIADLIAASRARLDEYDHVRIFYVCSTHHSPACDHKDYQGKLYVDRNWRSVLRQEENMAWLETIVEEFIKENKILTVQKAISAPIYLTTRPYCKHYLISVGTVKALTTPAAELSPQTRGHLTKRNATYEYIKKRLG